MEEETFQKIVMGGLVLLAGLLYFNAQLTMNLNSTIQEAAELQCNQVVDMIYEQCAEEEAIDIKTLKGRNTTLTYEHGVCVIK